MRTLLRWLALVLTLIVARVLLALAILVGVLLLIGAGLQSLGLPAPTQRQIAKRIDAARADLAPLLARIRAATEPPRPPNSAPASVPRLAQSAPSTSRGSVGRPALGP